MIDDVFIYGKYVWDQNNLNSWNWAFVQWKQGKQTLPAVNELSSDFVCMNFNVKNMIETRAVFSIMLY